MGPCLVSVTAKCHHRNLTTTAEGNGKQGYSGLSHHFYGGGMRVGRFTTLRSGDRGTGKALGATPGAAVGW